VYILVLTILDGFFNSHTHVVLVRPRRSLCVLAYRLYLYLMLSPQFVFFTWSEITDTYCNISMHENCQLPMLHDTQTAT